jgi:V8-like Glu-specific endopeptidase
MAHRFGFTLKLHSKEFIMFKKIIIASFAFASLVLVLAGCSGTENASETKNVFGRDDRQAMTSSSFPWSAVGYLGGCTATLVASDLIVTAAHCVVTDSGGYETWLRFRPNYQDGSSRDSADATVVAVGTTSPDNDRENDWALLRLDEALGDSYGYVSVGAWSAADFSGRSITVVGYSNNFRDGDTAGIHENCSVQDLRGDMILHDCDTSRGSSGGPVFVGTGRSTQLVGLNVAEYRDGGDTSLVLPYFELGHANIAIPASRFASRLASLGGRSTPPYNPPVVTPPVVTPPASRGGCLNQIETLNQIMCSLEERRGETPEIGTAACAELSRREETYGTCY